MSSFNEQNGQYRRPRPHFSTGPVPSVSRRSLLTGSALLMALAMMMVLAMIPLRTEDADPAAEQTSRDASQTLQADCAVIQQITYAPCGHQMTRRTALPGELTGKGRAELEAAYSAWQVISFSPSEVSMVQTLDMHCPQHIILLPDESGRLCAWQNKYGDALALVKELDTAVSGLPDEAQDEVRQGKGFDTLEDLEKWLESVES